MMEEFLTARLLRPASLTQPEVADRVHWGMRPDKEAFPAITLTVVDGGEEYHHEGKDNLLYSRIQADVWGKSYGSAKLASRTLVNELEARYENDDVVFEEALVLRNMDRTPDTLAGGTKVFGVLLEFLVPFILKGA